MGCCQTDSKKNEDLLQVTLSPKTLNQEAYENKYALTEENLPGVSIQNYMADLSEIYFLDKMLVDNDENFFKKQANDSEIYRKKQNNFDKNYDLPMPAISEYLNEESEMEKTISSKKIISIKNSLQDNSNFSKKEQSNSQKQHFQPFRLIVDVDVIENPTPKFNVDNALQKQKQNEGNQSERLNTSLINESRDYQSSCSAEINQSFELKFLKLEDTQKSNLQRES